MHLEPAPTIDETHLDAILDQAFNKAASKVLPDGMVEGTSTMVPVTGQPNQDLPNVTVGGREYKPTGFLGSGGYAYVYEYTSLDDPDTRIALKVGKEATTQGVNEAISEISVHQSAYGEGCNELVGFEGKVRLPDGRFGIAMEIAPNGNVFDMGKLISNSTSEHPQPGSGEIAGFEADILRLTMLQDMAKGLEHMHSVQGVTHYDFKSPNTFIGKDGTSKVADFGLSLTSEETTGLDKGKAIDNPLYKAPEIHRGEALRSNIEGTAKESWDLEARRKVEKLALMLPLAPNDTLVTLAQSILEPRRREIEDQKETEKSMLFFDRKIDVWGLGASALHLFTGREPLGHDVRFITPIARGLVAFGSNRNNQPLSDPDENNRPQNGSVGLKTGKAQIDDLISRMLAPDPRDRGSPSELLEHPAFTSIKGVGSPEAKALIVALNSGDKAKIDEARFALQNVL